MSGVDLEISGAATTAIIGPSGCGKSTLLRLIVGLIMPDTGTILINGQPLVPDGIDELRHRIGYVIQDGGLFPHLTARGNASLVAAYLGWTETRIKKRLEELSVLTRLPRELLEQYPSELSGGQQQRVSLVRALMLDPDLLLLDEPLGALDPMIRYELQQELKAIFSRLNKTVVLVTHDMAEASYFSDHIVLMREGQIIQSGSFGDLKHAPTEPFVAEFIRAQRQVDEGSQT